MKIKSFDCLFVLLLNNIRIQSILISDISKQSVIAHLKTSIQFITEFSLISSPDIRESIAKSFSYLPGYGQPDIYYPLFFLGDWTAQTQLSTSISNGYNSSFFIPFDKSIISSRKYINYRDNIILDRSYSDTSYYRNLLNDPNLITIWDFQNPNNFKIVLSDSKV
jgi:hypothetical protein